MSYAKYRLLAVVYSMHVGLSGAFQNEPVYIKTLDNSVKLSFLSCYQCVLYSTLSSVHQLQKLLVASGLLDI